MATTHYRLKSSIQLGETVRVAGSTISTEEFATLCDEAQELLIRDEHVVECEAPTPVAEIPSPFPRKREKK